MSLFRVSLVVLFCTVILGAIVGLFVPSLRPLLIEEDSLVETATATLFFAAGAVALWRARRSSGRRLQLLVAAIGFLGFLDEISFGERLLSLEMPKVLGVKLDAVHDLVELAVVALGRWFASNPVTCLLVIVALLIAAAWMFPRVLGASKAWLHGVRHHEAFRLACLFAAMAVAVIVLDLDFFHSRALVALEEVLELNAAFVLLAISLKLVRAGEAAQNARSLRSAATAL